MLVCIFVFKPECLTNVLLPTASSLLPTASSLLPCHCLTQSLVVSAVTCWPCLPQQHCAVQLGSGADFWHRAGVAGGVAALQSQPAVPEMPQPRSCAAEVLLAYPA